MKVYVASSWRNEHQPNVVSQLREAGHEVYDFRNPKPGDDGFHWSEVDANWKTWQIGEYIDALCHPLAEEGFAADFDAMKWADACVLVLPCGRSAHLEGGYFVGAGKPLLIYIPGAIEPELMYKMADRIYATPASVITALELLDKGSSFA